MLNIRRDDIDILARALAEVDRELAKCDYTPGRPPWLTAEAARIDRAVCADSTCERCGRAGLEWYPAYRTAGPRPQYAAYAACPACGEWFLF
jgi:hypothetical protein